MHKNLADIDILTNLSYFSKVVECHFNYVVNMKRHRYGVIANDADITRLICRLDDISSYFDRRKPRGQSEPRMENEKFRFVSLVSVC